MQKSEMTKKFERKRIKSIIFSWLLTFGVAIALIIYGFATKWNHSPDSEIGEKFKALLITITMTFLPLIILSFVVKDKIKPTIRMINLILAAYLVANWFMYIVGALMIIDTYIISPRAEKFKIRANASAVYDMRENLNGKSEENE